MVWVPPRGRGGLGTTSASPNSIPRGMDRGPPGLHPVHWPAYGCDAATGAD